MTEKRSTQMNDNLAVSETGQAYAYSEPELLPYHTQLSELDEAIQTEITGQQQNVIPNRQLSYRIAKRLFDIVASAAGLVMLSLLFLLIAAAIRIDSPGKAIFLQDRNGLNGKVFKMYKFRSMFKGAEKLRASMEAQNELDGPAFKMTNDPRITRIGRFIRKTSLDELPQLINIFLGNMSFVGPRPLPTYETEQLNDYQRQRLLAKPGLLCTWQVSGRNDIEFDEWMEMDLSYINHASFMTDMKIILRAFPAVLGHKGAY